MLKRLFNGQLPGQVLFDLDGTLVDSVPDLAAAVDHMLISLGRVPAGEEAVRDWVGNGAQVLVARALAGRASVPDTPDPLFRDALALWQEYYAAHCADLSQLYPGVRECLESLTASGVKLGVVTNKPMRFTTPMLEAFDLDALFEVIVGGDTLAVKKPDPAPLLHAVEQLGGSPHTSLMVGDSRHDIGCARAAGIAVVAVNYGYNHGEPVEQFAPDILVSDLTQLVR